MNTINDLGCATNVEVINQLVSLEGKFVIDAGCGSMTFTRELSDLGARVLAIDPDPVQAELNRRADPIPNVDFVETGADQLPVEQNQVDGLFFSYSLHHIPKEIYPSVFDEVFRVVEPGGFLIVIEPIESTGSEVIDLFHNEEEERTAAARAVTELAVPAFNSARIVTYHNIFNYDSFEHFVQRFARRTFNPGYTEADIRRPIVREAFERLGGPDHSFVSRKQVWCLQGLKTATNSG